MQQQEREAEKGDMSAAHACRMPGSAAEQLPIALSVGIKGQTAPTAADLSASQRSGSWDHSRATGKSHSDDPTWRASGGALSSRPTPACGVGAGMRGAVSTIAHAAASGQPVMSSHSHQHGAAHSQPAHSSPAWASRHEVSTWQALMDDVDELECDATPAKQQQRPQRSWQASALPAADEACFATNYDWL